jgi:hypothetical protein
VTITFSEAVTGFSLSDLSVANGTLSNLASSDGGKTWTATFTPTRRSPPDQPDRARHAGICDAAGNAGAGIAISNNYGIDGERPSATMWWPTPLCRLARLHW